MSQLEDITYYEESKEDITEDLVRDLFNDGIADTNYEDVEIQGIQMPHVFSNEDGSSVPIDLILENGRTLFCSVVLKDTEDVTLYGVTIELSRLPEEVEN